MSAIMRELMAAGLEGDALLSAIERIEFSEVKTTEIRPDSTTERRRARDRERYRLRQISTEIPPKTTETTETTEIHNPPLNKEESKKVIKKRGSRIPAEWQPTEADIEFAIAKGMSRQRADTEAEKFRNYWTAKSGDTASKLDWSATWRNWVLQSIERIPGDVRPTGPPDDLDWKKPPWEREGISEKAWRERELAKLKAPVRGNPGASQNGADHAPKLQLSGGVAFGPEGHEAERPASDHIPWDG